MKPTIIAQFLAFLSLTCLQVRGNEDLEFFEKRIRPVLAEKCYSCHSADSKKLKGDLQLDHREHMLTGGDTGPVIVSGDLDNSLLIEAIRYHNEELQMPPKGKLTAEIVRDFESWISTGAPWPEESIPQRDGGGGGDEFDLQKRYEKHWSWRPVIRPEVPAVATTDWAKGDIDRFVLKSIEGSELLPAEEADRRTWLRRVYFDLIGLPPTPEQQLAFLEDESDRAYEKVVDELLASSHYGEKWARHWMDLVRYSDTYGHEYDYPISYAHQYRDYLIRAFNEDVPYDLFVKEHIAGDMLENPRRNPEKQYNESILGTAFWYFHEASHAPTDVLGNEADIMDNQIDVFGKTFLGLTVSCARCHDHKFDAISTKDYYALTGYLQSSARQEVIVDSGRQREKTFSELVMLRESAGAIDDACAVKKPIAVSEDETVYEEFDSAAIPEGWSTTGEAFVATGTAPGLRFNNSSSVSLPGMIDSGLYGKEQVGILRSPTFTISTNHIHLLVKGNAADIKLIIDNYQMSKFQALLFKGTIHKNLETKGGFQWVSLTGDLRKYRGHKAYLEFIDAGDGDLIIDEIRFSKSANAPKLSESIAHPKHSENQNSIIKQGIALSKSLSKPEFAVAMAEGTSEKAKVYVRGSHRSLGEEVPARFLEALGSVEGDRLTLANEVTNPKNPQASRVMVNRLWHHLFGRGLVASVDDFGPMGRIPTHPELLDWLAAEFVDQGWSIKSMIRQLVLSASYRQSSDLNPGISPSKLAEVDPDNLLLSRMPVKRLTGEAIRDNILAVSGELNRDMYGPSIPTHRTEFMTGRGGKKSGPIDGDGRRSIYGAIYRNFLSPFMMTFDVPGPFGPKGRRSVSNVPAQALVLMNDPFIIEQSTRWAESLSKTTKSNEELVGEVFLSGLGRLPSQPETDRLIRFLKNEKAKGGSAVEARASLIHVVMNMKEFIFIN